MEARRLLAIDAAVLALYLVAANPALTGIGVHEWLALGMFVLFVVHAAMHVDWVVDAAKGSRDGLSWARAGNLVLDVLILAVFVMVTVSGLLVSGAVLPTFGLYAPGYYFWDPLHAVSAKALFALLLVHVAVHGKWMVGCLKRRKGEDGGERNDR